jgi:hypothetical protein
MWQGLKPGLFAAICGTTTRPGPAQRAPRRPGTPVPRHPGTPVVPFQNIDDHLRGGHHWYLGCVIW